MATIDQVLYWTYDSGILIFFLVYALVFAVLQKVKLFTKGKGADAKADRKINSVIALVMGLMVMVPHYLGFYPPGLDIVEIINSSIPQVSVVLVGILMALIIIGFLGRRVKLGGNHIAGWIALLAFGIVGYIFLTNAYNWVVPYWLAWLFTEDNMMILVVLLVFALVIYFITKSDEGPKKGENESDDDFKKRLLKKKLGYQLAQALLEQEDDKKKED